MSRFSATSDPKLPTSRSVHACVNRESVAATHSYLPSPSGRRCAFLFCQSNFGIGLEVSVNAICRFDFYEAAPRISVGAVWG